MRVKLHVHCSDNRRIGDDFYFLAQQALVHFIDVAMDTIVTKMFRENFLQILTHYCLYSCHNPGHKVRTVTQWIFRSSMRIYGLL